jgi:hypothetical protein
MTTKEKIATLEEEIKEYSTVVSSNSYSMSVGELASMYKEGELNLHPEFQRFFRWTDGQKSRFIESLLLGIPIPPIFVAQRDDGKWDVIDGLQRLSTIFELMGELLDKNGKKKKSLILTKTKYLEALQNKIWSSSDDSERRYNPENELPTSVKIVIKRARFDVNIVKSGSDKMAKYEIFQRLNTGGSLATPQEVRNCVLLMTSEDFFNWFKELGKYPNFRDCLVLTNRKEEEAFDLELLTRFIVMVNSKISKLQEIDELDSFLTDEIQEIASKNDFDKRSLQSAFEKTFDFLNETLEENSFKKFNVSRNKYSGPVLMSLFEIVAAGLGYRLLHGYKLPDPQSFKEEHKSILSDTKINRTLNIISNSGSGINSRTRIPNTVKYGRNWFEQWE